MRKRFGIGVVAAALLLGLVAPGVKGATGSEQLVMAGNVSEIGTVLKRVVNGLGWIVLGRSPLDLEKVYVATRELEGIVPRTLRTPLGEVRVPTDRERWQMIYVGCWAKDVDEYRRQQQVAGRLLLLGGQVPGAIGNLVSVYNLANELDKAKSGRERTAKAAAEALCRTAQHKALQRR